MSALKGKPQRTKYQVSQDKAFIAELCLKGYTQQRMADLINERYKMAGSNITITVPSVNRDLKQIKEEWQKSANERMEEHKILQLKKLDALELEYWNSWQKSIKKDTRRTISKKIAYRGGEEIKQSESKEEDYYGDPRFLDGINKCIQQRSALLGLTKEDGSITNNNNLIITIEESSVGVVFNQ
jgi:hypothetical protein